MSAAVVGVVRAPAARDTGAAGGAARRPVRQGAPPEQGWGRRAWGAIWRTLVAVFLGMVAVAGVQWQIDSGERALGSDALAALDLFLGVIALGLMHLRRRWPLTIAVTLAAFLAVSNLSVGAASVVAVSLATTRRWISVAAVGVVFTASSLVYVVLNPYLSDPLVNRAVDTGMGMLSYGLLVAVGAYIGLRRDHLRSLVVRAETAEREQASRVAQARSNERARIAREMHDVLAHRISLVAMHAGALAYRKDLPREQVESAAETIRDEAHRAMSELREILGVLRELPDGGGVIGHEGDDVHRPQPTLESLPALVGESRAAGLDVTFHDDRATPATLPESTSRTAFRIVQEGLTNARKHAAGRPVVATVAGAPGDGLAITVANPLPRGEAATEVPASGLGLMGLTERAELGGGTLRYGVEGGRFVVRAWLPWAA
ncbi:sensor histidine kinase [Myceligenerans crystallogenes]|uniref:histidine kinase n=1 Tax=Myceligenerans crystallogenes TaxID=316335 RepID=A0ABN2N551_9MICO